MAFGKSTSARAGTLIDGQFRLERLLGEGGMGTVWSAQDLQLQRQVAVKLLSKTLSYNEQARARFELEAQLIARINSPHVVQVFAQGRTEQNLPFLVMELLRGEDLGARIARMGPCALHEAAPIVAQICRGLGRAHQLGLVHRDIKPQNIFLVRDDAEQQDVDHGEVLVKLLDFGIAKDLSAQFGKITLHGEVIGSPRYISPEQLRDPQSVDAGADIWTVGIVIYEMLTGHTPFDAQSLTELYEQHLDGRFRAASSVVADLPPELDELLCRAIHIDREQRFQSVEELGEAFACLVRLHDSTAHAMPPMPPLAAPRSSSSRIAGAQAASLREASRSDVTHSDLKPEKTRVVSRFALIATSLLLVAGYGGFMQVRRGPPANVRLRSTAIVAPIVLDPPAAQSGSGSAQPAVHQVAPQLDPPAAANDVTPTPLAPPPSAATPEAPPKLRTKELERRHNPERQPREIRPHVAAQPEASELPVSIEPKAKTKPQRPEPRNHGF